MMNKTTDFSKYIGLYSRSKWDPQLRLLNFKFRQNYITFGIFIILLETKIYSVNLNMYYHILSNAAIQNLFKVKLKHHTSLPIKPKYWKYWKSQTCLKLENIKKNITTWNSVFNIHTLDLDSNLFKKSSSLTRCKFMYLKNWKLPRLTKPRLGGHLIPHKGELNINFEFPDSWLRPSWKVLKVFSFSRAFSRSNPCKWELFSY